MFLILFNLIKSPVISVNKKIKSVRQLENEFEKNATYRCKGILILDEQDNMKMLDWGMRRPEIAKIFVIKSKKLFFIWDEKRDFWKIS